MYAYPYPYTAPVPPVGVSTKAEPRARARTVGAMSLSFLQGLRGDWRFGLAAGGALCVALAAWSLGDSWRPAFPPAVDAPSSVSAPLISEAEAAQPRHIHIIADEAPPPPAPTERPVRAIMDTQDADTATDLQPPASAPTSAARAADTPARLTPASFSSGSDACAGLAAPSARMVCASPALADRARRLRVAYGRALQTSSDPDELQAEQTRWLTLRDEAAANGGEPAVAALYDRRIRALDPSE
jgi:uncharacterized protein YecT (DUF1311 family)